MSAVTGVRRALANVRCFADGVVYGGSMGAPAPGPCPETAADGRLATYFESHAEGAGVWKWRHYFPVYERHFARFVGREVHVVEVGVYSGGSLQMWRDYFGPDATIYGVDIEPACLKHAETGARIFIGDQADPAFWKDFLRQVPRVDILVDDGGHQPDQQITTLKAVLPAMSPGGVYVCEDSTGAAHAFHAFVDGLGRRLHSMNPDAAPTGFHQHVASVHRYPFLTVIEKPSLPVARFDAPRHGSTWEPAIGLDHVLCS